MVRTPFPPPPQTDTVEVRRNKADWPQSALHDQHTLPSTSLRDPRALADAVQQFHHVDCRTTRAEAAPRPDASRADATGRSDDSRIPPLADPLCYPSPLSSRSPLSSSPIVCATEANRGVAFPPRSSKAYPPFGRREDIEGIVGGVPPELETNAGNGSGKVDLMEGRQRTNNGQLRHGGRGRRPPHAANPADTPIGKSKPRECFRRRTITSRERLPHRQTLMQNIETTKCAV